jgi:hypothetical protein
MEITGNRNIICRLPFQLPRKWLDKAYKSLMLDYNKNANKSKIDEILQTNFDKVKVNNNLIQLEALENLIKITGLLNDTKILDDVYEVIYGKTPKTKDDFEKPFKEKELLIQKSKQIFSTEDESNEEKKEVDIEILIRNIEMILKTKVRDDKFYLLAGHINQSAKLNQKDNG